MKTRMLPDENADTSGILTVSSNSTTCSHTPDWDPSRLVLRDILAPPPAPRKGRRITPVKGRFIAGPLDIAWLARARQLGVSALWVGLSLWYLRGLRKSDTFVVSNLMMQEWDVQADAKGRALCALENAGLITVERRGKRSPLVTIIVRGTTGGGAVVGRAVE